MLCYLDHLIGRYELLFWPCLRTFFSILPHPLTATIFLFNFSRGGVKNLYQLSRTVVWIVASSSVILFAPVIFEVERAQVEEMQKSQQKQVGTIIINDLRPFVGSDLFTKISPCISIVNARFPIICIIAFLQYYIHQENFVTFTINAVTSLT